MRPNSTLPFLVFDQSWNVLECWKRNPFLRINISLASTQKKIPKVHEKSPQLWVKYFPVNLSKTLCMLKGAMSPSN